MIHVAPYDKDDKGIPMMRSVASIKDMFPEAPACMDVAYYRHQLRLLLDIYGC